MTRIDLPLIDCHTHIGRLPGVVGEVFVPEDLVYICEHEGARFMLVSSASATTVSQRLATDEAITGRDQSIAVWPLVFHPDPARRDPLRAIARYIIERKR